MVNDSEVAPRCDSLGGGVRRRAARRQRRVALDEHPQPPARAGAAGRGDGRSRRAGGRCEARAASCSRCCTRSPPAPTRSTIATCFAPARPRRSSATRRWRPRRSAPSCAPSPSGTCASSTGCSAPRSSGRGGPGPAPARSAWWSTSTASSARCTATPSRGPRSATPAAAATTRCSPAGPTPARSCTSGSGREGRRARAGWPASPRSWSRAFAAPARTGEKLLRADSAFWNRKLIARLEGAGWRYSIGVRMQFWVPEAIAEISESAWQPLADYPEDGEAQIAETTAGGRRLIVRRTRLLGPQAELLAGVALLPVHHQPLRAAGGRRSRASPACRRRDPHRRPQGPGARPLSLRRLRRQRRLDGDRLPRPQPLPLDRGARPSRPHPARGPDDPPLARRPPGPAHPQRAALDASPAGPLALADGVHGGADPDQGARRRLIRPSSVLAARQGQRRPAPIRAPLLARRSERSGEHPARRPHPPFHRRSRPHRDWR